jgi:hypothetical protein
MWISFWGAGQGANRISGGQQNPTQIFIGAVKTGFSEIHKINSYIWILSRYLEKTERAYIGKIATMEIVVHCGFFGCIVQVSLGGNLVNGQRQLLRHTSKSGHKKGGPEAASAFQGV